MLLVVDDDPAFLVLAQRQLGAGARGVLFARDIRAAKSLMRTVGSAFSVVLIDLMLRGEDGLSLIAELHRNFPDLPVIAMTACAGIGALDRARAVGAADALEKPIDNMWRAAIARAMLRRKARGAV